MFLIGLQPGLLENQTSSANVVGENLPQLALKINGFGEPSCTFQIVKHAELWRKSAFNNLCIY
jgi:hypothetical protein